MLKKCLFIIILLLFSSGLWAYEKGDMFLYPKGGLGVSIGPKEIFSVTSIFPDTDIQPGLTWNLGGAFEYFVIGNLTVDVELLYESQTLSYRDKYTGLIRNFNFSYITIPIGVHYFFPKYLFLGGGFYYGFRFNSDISIKSDGKLRSVGSIAYDTKDDYGLFADLGLNVKLSESNNLFIYLRYKHGLNTLIGEKIYNEKIDLKPYVLTINAAYTFKF